MNERIRELFEQALEEFKAENKYATIIVPNPLKEKFALSIVRECADIMDGRDENGNAKDGQYLLTQFGIDASHRYT
jgi:hypothetical protein